MNLQLSEEYLYHSRCNYDLVIVFCWADQDMIVGHIDKGLILMAMLAGQFAYMFNGL